MPTATEKAAEKVAAAHDYTNLFGIRPNGDPKAWLDSARKEHRRLVRLLHPDRGGEEGLFAKLGSLWGQAQNAADDDDANGPATIGSPNGARYTVSHHIARDDIGDLYLGVGTASPDEFGNRVIFHIAHQPADQDLLDGGYDILEWIHTAGGDDAGAEFLPFRVDRFSIDGQTGPRPVVALAVRGNLYTLAEVQREFPAGVDPKVMAWIWRRLLGVLRHVHSHGVVHGAVLPHNILVDPAYGLQLVGWACATSSTAGVRPHVPAVDSGHRDWYPPSVFAREPADTAVDIITAARSMAFILGGDPVTGDLPPTVPKEIKTHLRACMAGVSDAASAASAFDRLIERLWGERAYTPFTMPARQPTT